MGIEVLIVGAGPTGLMLAAELALAGVEVVIVERRTDQRVDGARAGGLLPRSLEVLDQRGVVDRFVEAGRCLPSHGFAGIPLDLRDLPSRHNCVLALPQREFEPILAAWVLGELGVSIVRDASVVDLRTGEREVGVLCSDGRRVDAEYVIGCDGGRSLVRKRIGVDFVGAGASRSWLIAEIDAVGDPPLGRRFDGAGMHGLGRSGGDGPLRVVLSERSLGSGQPAIDELEAELAAAYGSDLRLGAVHWVSRFTDATRRAATYRRGRVLLAGDAAHIHPPHGGQGLNTGLQDAVNLGWKLARVVDGDAADDLLDTYGAERGPVADRVLGYASAQVAAMSGGPSHAALRTILGDVVAMDEPRRHLAAALTALDVAYDVGQGAGAHPLVGRRMPDVSIQTSRGRATIYPFLHQGRALLFRPTGGQASAPPPVPTIDGSVADDIVLPVIGPVDRPESILIRPDGHVAWAGDASDPGLDGALHRWCAPSPGPATRPPLQE